MGYKTENWQDIEVGDVVEVLFHTYNPPLTFTGEKVVQTIISNRYNLVCITVFGDNTGEDLWSLIVSDDGEDQVKLIRKHNANS